MTNIRNACPADAPRLLEIYDHYVRRTAITFEYVTPTLSEFERRIAQTRHRYPWLVVEQDGVVQGYAYAGVFKDRPAYDWCCELSIYLDRSAQHRGLARRLYEALEQALARMGLRNLYACVALPEVEDEYLTRNSVDFHTHLGYDIVGTFRNCGYKFGRWYHMVWMEKRIGDTEGETAPVVPYPALCEVGGRR